MAIKELTKQDILVIESMTKSFSSEIWKLKKKYEIDQSKTDLFAPLYNLKDLVMLRLFDYHMPLKSTDKIREILDKIFKTEESKNEEELALEQEQKDDIILLISSAMAVHNGRFKESATEEEKKKATALYTEHFKAFVFFTTNSFAYKNEFDTSNKQKFRKTTRTLKDSEKKVISETITTLGANKDKPDEKIAFINDEHLYIINGAFKKIYTTLADDYLSIYSNDSDIDIRISLKDLIPYIKSGKVKLGADVVIVEASSDTKSDSERTTPVPVKPTQIEQPKPGVAAKPVAPVAQAKQTPAHKPAAAVAKPEPAVDKAEAFLETVAVATEAVDADDEEQAMLDELPEHL